MTTPFNRITDRSGDLNAPVQCRSESSEFELMGSAQIPTRPSSAVLPVGFSGLTLSIAGQSATEGLYSFIVEDKQENQELQNQIRECQREIVELRLLVEHLLSKESQPSYTGRDPRLADVVAVTQELFPGEPTIDLSRDPEDPDNPFVVITVKARADSAELLNRRFKWHDRIRDLTPGHSGSLRLTIIPE
jgi:hypothetical protein